MYLNRTVLRRTFVFAGALACLLASVLLYAQSPSRKTYSQKQRQQRNMPSVEMDGSYIGLRGSVMHVKNIHDENWQCQFAQNAYVVAKGDANRDFLQKGACISFTANVHLKRGQVEDPVTEVTFFTPDAYRPQGVFLPEHASELYVSREDMKLKQQMSQMGGGMGMGMGMGTDMGAMSAEPGEKRGKVRPPESRELVIRGTIKTFNAKAGLMTLSVPANPYVKNTIRCTISESVTVDAVLGGRSVFGFAKPGNSVQLTGKQIGPTQMQVQYMELTPSGELEIPGKKNKKVEKKTSDDSTPATEPAPAPEKKTPEKKTPKKS